MKRTLLTILVVLFALSGQAQTEHMKFKGIPMEGNLDAFVQQLRAQGYALEETEDNVLAGEFGGHKGCYIIPSADRLGNICKVSVMFPAMDKWGDLASCYESYKSMLTEKYGAPTRSEERFEKRYDGDNAERMRGVQLDKYVYYSVFSCAAGDIRLEVNHHGPTLCFVQLTYADKAGQAAQRQQIMEDL